MDSYDDNARRPRVTKKGGLGCGGCLLILIGLYIASQAWDWFEEKQEEVKKERSAEKQAEKRAEKLDEIEEFGREHATALQKAIEELRAQTVVHAKRVGELRGELEALGRDPRRDKDYVRWAQQLDELRQKTTDLENKRDDAYLEWRKYLISRSADEEARFNEAVERGEAAALETEKRLRELIEDSKK